MPRAPFLRPDVLVLGVGGVQGEAWLTGVLAGITDAADVDFRDVDFAVGSSAGSIVAARLMAREPLVSSDPDLDDAELDSPTPRGIGERAIRGVIGRGLALAAPLVPTALAATAPGGAIVRSALLGGVAGSRSADALRASMDALYSRFDGRLRVVAVDRRSGHRVVFGAPGAPDASVADAVTASCSVPWMFEPVRIGGREYTDAGAWSPTNLDVAPAHRDTHVLCLAPTGRTEGVPRSIYGVLSALGSSATALEATVLRRRGARVTVVVPDAASARAMGSNLMSARHAEESRHAGERQGRRLARAHS